MINHEITYDTVGTCALVAPLSKVRGAVPP